MLSHLQAMVSVSAAFWIAASAGGIVSASGSERMPAPQPEIQPPQAENPHAAEDRVLIEYLTRRHQVDAGRTSAVIDVVREASREAGLDPLLILAVIGIESNFNPAAQSSAGAMGLMQIIPMWHRDKLAAFGGEAAVLEPEPNIVVGTRILKEYIAHWGGLEYGLQRYNGAAWDSSAEYARKVLAELGRLRAVVARI